MLLISGGHHVKSLPYDHPLGKENCEKEGERKKSFDLYIQVYFALEFYTLESSLGKEDQKSIIIVCQANVDPKDESQIDFPEKLSKFWVVQFPTNTRA